MYIIAEKLISEDIFSEAFVCDISKCKGACCVEGDFGAPLEDKEIDILIQDYQKIKPFLTKEGIEEIDKNGVYTYFEENDENGTTLIEGGACAFLTYEKGVALCGIEKAHKAGVTSFLKPISCHLYPIRVSKNESANFEALNYDRWDICKDACAFGKENQVKIYRFLKEPLIRKYGEAFYEELAAAGDFHNQK